jgi:hypothetical protein
MEYQNNQENFKPSKKFLIRGGLATGILALILIVQTPWFLGLFSNKKSKEVVVSTATIGEIVGKDSNGNGIADWEERLWGLDPNVTTTNGVSNLFIIKEKRATLVQNGEIGPLNETDVLAQDLFSLSVALGQEGETNKESIGALAGKLSTQNLKKDTTPRYSIKNIQTTKTTPASLLSYKTSFTQAFKGYDESTQDIEIFLGGIETGNYAQLTNLDNVINQYQQITQKLLSIVVPIGVAEYHLQILNGIDGFSRAFYKMKTFEDNSIVGLVGFAEYRELDTKVEIAVSKLLLYFEQYGII